MKLIRILQFLPIVFYPVIIYWCISQGMPVRFLIIPLLIAGAVQITSQNSTALRAILLGLIVLLSLGLGVYQNALFLKLYPVLINLIFLFTFVLSLKGESIIEKFARLSGAPLNNEKVRSYCRNVTKVWCAFFVFNASLAAISIFLSLEWWTLYNGLIAYFLMGGLFIGEFLIRQKIIRAK